MPTRSPHRRQILVALLATVSATLASAPRAQPGGARQTLTGAAAQKSPQADLFIAYEAALLDGGLEAADRYMSQAKRDEVREALKTFGPDAFQQMQAEKRKTRLPPAERRKQIRKVEVSGDYAYLEARSGPGPLLDVAGFVKTAEGWKVAPVRR